MHWKEFVAVYFKVPFLNCTGRTEKNNEKPQEIWRPYYPHRDSNPLHSEHKSAWAELLRSFTVKPGEIVEVQKIVFVRMWMYLFLLRRIEKSRVRANRYRIMLVHAKHGERGKKAPRFLIRRGGGGGATANMPPCWCCGCCYLIL
jgi:hypothetical protein